MQYSETHILVVDDEDGIRDLFKDNLEEQGYICHAAPSGDAALEVLANDRVDLALVDVMMPGMTGLSLFQHVKERYPGVAVVFVTAMDDLDLAVDYLKNGAYDYVVKPVTRRRLQQVVEEALERRRVTLDEQQHRRLLEEQTAHQARALESRVRELSSLNRMFQTELSEKFTTVEAAYLKAQTPREQQLRQRVMSLRESEKKHISDYLHGHVQSKLLILQQRLRQCQELVSLDPEQASTLLEEIRVELKSVQEDDIRRTSHELYPYVVNLGLVPALRSLVDRFKEAIPIELSIGAELRSREEGNRRLFPEEFKVGVYRIAEEALDNAVKHAHAEMVKVKLYCRDDGRIYLDITDDGRGFETDRASSAYGLLAMKDYAEALGGSCQIESVPGRGTSIHLTLPVPANA